MVRDIESNHSRFGNPSRVWINESWYEIAACKGRRGVVEEKIAAFEHHVRLDGPGRSPRCGLAVG
jgi:hypothetical protein